MTEPRHVETGPGGARPWTGRIGAAATRARRPRIVDEERRLLREAEAAFAGRENKRADADAAGHLPWDEETDVDPSPSSRLFRE
ncbi:hypothetical protein [Xanthobacter sp. KR7-225]|uniref:hypothetical protein n=1 Tax=Xanthobacter sp. KR7-225 TaxID=3156613 RepID=UPI0032B5FB48